MSGRYRITGTLGSGGMGVVFRAVQRDLGREVALKVLLPEAASDPEHVARFRREVQACAALSHPNIVKILDFGENDEGRIFYTMELLVARGLDEVWRERGALPADEVAVLMSQAADALAYLHERGMVHRDIKPSNLMVDGRGRLFVMDFGVVKIGGQSGLTAVGERVGTPRYMSPETVEGVMEGPWVDVYGLGLSFWELAAGRVAFSGSSRSSLVAWIVQTGPQQLAEISPGTPAWLSRLIGRMVERKPDDRPTAAEVRDACRNVVGVTTAAFTIGTVGAAESTGAGAAQGQGRPGSGPHGCPVVPAGAADQPDGHGGRLDAGLVSGNPHPPPLSASIGLGRHSGRPRVGRRELPSPRCGAAFGADRRAAGPDPGSPHRGEPGRAGADRSGDRRARGAVGAGSRRPDDRGGGGGTARR
ncbi:MAG: serine/threonine protein kinase [Candidatus Riflebacteria bacterium]|nr:serine/threonine protein kinase [Candidatus Riflebacteria bacterium]